MNELPDRGSGFSRKAARLPFFYGWVVIGLGTFGILASIPGQTIGVSVFTDYLIDVLAISRDQLSLTYMLGTIGSATMLTWAGKQYDRFGVRRMAVIAAVGLALTLLFFSQSDRVIFAVTSDQALPVLRFLILTAGFVCLRFFGQGILTMVSRNMMMKWFERRRGFAMSFSNVFLALGFSSSPLLLEYLINEFTWRGAWQWMAVGLLTVVTGVILLFFRDNPESMGLQPDGNYRSKRKRSPASWTITKRDFTLREARATLIFWVFAMALAMQGFYITGLTFHVASIFEESGLTREVAIRIFQPTAVIAVCFTLFFSWISDLIRLKYLVWVMCLGAMLSCVGLVLLRPDSIAYYLVIVGNGVMAGLYGVIQSVSWPRFFAKRYLGAISGQAMTLIVFGSALGPVVFSYSLSIFGSYTPAAVFTFCLWGILFILALRVVNPQELIEE